jgi:hypothetical protein
MNLSIQGINSKYKKKVVNLLALQQFPKLDGFFSSLYFNPEKGDNKIEEKNGKTKDIKLGQEVHLILEGVGNSSEYVGGLYSIIEDIYTEVENKLSSPKNQKP